MKFDGLLHEINKKYETKLILDEVSFFKIENEIEITLLSKEIVDENNIKIFLNEHLKDFDIKSEIIFIYLDNILEYFELKFNNAKYELKDDKFVIFVSHEGEISLYKNKDLFNRFEKKINKLNINIDFQIQEIENEDELEKLRLEKEELIKLEIEEAHQKAIKVETKRTRKVEIVEDDEVFTYGNIKRIPTELTEFDELLDNISIVALKGTVYEIEMREIKNSTLITFDLDNGYKAIRCKLFVDEKKVAPFHDNFKPGLELLVSGKYNYDEYEKAMVFNVVALQETVLSKRIDMADDKRIEMNIHSKYSNLESIVDLKELFKTLKDFGHEAVGITDLFNVQAYPEIYGYAKRNGIKLNLGLQSNFVENYPSLLTNHYNLSVENKDFVVFDIETTGLNKFQDKIIEFGAVKIRDGKIIEVFEEFVNPEMILSDFTTELTGITNEMVSNAETIDIVLPKFIEFIDNCVIVAHNAEFDVGFIVAKTNENNINFKPLYMDTLYISRSLHPDFKNHKLDTLAKNYRVSLLNHHRASDDARATAEIFIKMLQEFEEKGNPFDSNINKIKTSLPVSNNMEYQNILYAQNKIGLKNLYTIVSKSNIDYFYREPRIPLDEFEKLNEGIIIGTGNYKSKLFYLISNFYDDEILENEIKKYDFAVLIPLSFSEHLINRAYIKDEDHLKSINNKIIELADKFDIPAIAMGDVYYIDKKDYPYRNILKNYPRKRGLENSGAFYLKNTFEMLEEFNYLDEKTRQKVVIDNSHILNEMIENFSPIADGTFPPKIENAENKLSDDSYEIAKSIYGENLPDIVEKRLERELGSIIGNGYATLYMIAKMLVKKSNEDGYLVGSRGSVGSSFAATMAEITEVNPLPPHYVCTKCKHVEFVESTEYYTGVDLPKKHCPNCDIDMKRDGFDIPFETFLGFEGDKEPDIDLNFASVYQSKIHKYTESLFGRTKVFRAGTLGTIADKTAIGMALRFKEFYPDDETILSDRPNLNRVKRKIVGVKRTTGQHAGGLIIVPEDKDIEDFTPVQYPADKSETGIITTHFDYHAIDKNLLKLDLLGHNSPTIIRLLTDMSGIDAVNIDLSDPDTMDIFRSTDKLNIIHDYTNINNGSLGIPEFGTKFVRGMLDDTKPTTFEELIRISGLSHGTDVWLGNAQQLIKDGIADLKGTICTRDDIMNYLIEKGMDSKLSFDIMEQVRKGKGVNEHQIEKMKEANVPQWYIDSCLKIKYMFPKAHAVAYVMMSYRIAYFKVHHPEHFYAVTFTNDISDFKYGHISQGLKYISTLIETLKQENEIDNVFYVYELVEEMFARGINFAEIDLYKSHPTNFEVVGDKLILPPLMAIDSVSESMALRIDEARKDGEFISKEDFIKRTKINKSAIEKIEEAGLFKDLEDTNQISFFNL